MRDLVKVYLTYSRVSPEALHLLNPSTEEEVKPPVNVS